MFTRNRLKLFQMHFSNVLENKDIEQKLDITNKKERKN